MASSERLEARLRRLEQQVRAFRELHLREMREQAERLGTIARIQSDELQLILDELSDITKEVAAQREAEGGRRDVATDAPVADAPASAPVDSGGGSPEKSDDPAAGSPKRAKWLAEQEKRRARLQGVSRRELLLGRDDDPAERGPS